MWMQISVFFRLHLVIMNVDAGICFLFSFHVVVLNVDIGICFLSSLCSSHECGYRDLFSFFFSYSSRKCGYRNLFSFLFM